MDADSTSSGPPGSVPSVRSPFRCEDGASTSQEVLVLGAQKARLSRCIKRPEIVCQRLKVKWQEQPKTAAIVIKRQSKSAALWARELARWLSKHGISVLVEPEVQKNESFQDCGLLTRETTSKVEFCISIGGDGTVLHLNSLFSSGVPPVISFARGSLGFLTPFELADYKNVLTKLLKCEEVLDICPRMRLWCTIQRRGQKQEEEKEKEKTKENENANETSSAGNASARDQHGDSVAHVRESQDQHGGEGHETVYQPLNEVLVDRGASPYMTTVDLLVNDMPATKVQADGIIISTPTGSTAYSLR